MIGSGERWGWWIANRVMVEKMVEGVRSHLLSAGCKQRTIGKSFGVSDPGCTYVDVYGCVRNLLKICTGSRERLGRMDYKKPEMSRRLCRVQVIGACLAAALT